MEQATGVTQVSTPGGPVTPCFWQCLPERLMGGAEKSPRPMSGRVVVGKGGRLVVGGIPELR